MIQKGWDFVKRHQNFGSAIFLKTVQAIDLMNWSSIVKDFDNSLYFGEEFGFNCFIDCFLICFETSLLLISIKDCFALANGFSQLKVAVFI